jgi:polysaccharide biosynthesis protein PslH
VKLLFLTPQLPYPPEQGTSIRNYHLIAELAKRHRITLLTFLEPDQNAESLGPLRQIAEHLEIVPAPPRSKGQRLRQLLTSRRPDMSWRLWSPELEERLKLLLKNNSFDVVQIEGIEMASYASAVAAGAAQPLLVYDDHNAEYLLQKRAFLTDAGNPRRWIAAMYSFIQWRRLRTYERAMCLRADRVITCSAADAGAIRELDTRLKVTVISNGVDLASHAAYQGEVRPHDLVFTGKMDFRPNIDAMLWFCQAVLPLIQARKPGVSLAIVGQRPHNRLESLRSLPAVTITGHVPDVRPFIAGAQVYIAPLRVGGGTRLKLLQAMAMGKAIVSTTLGAEGLDIQDGREMLLADRADEFASAVLSLMEQPEERRRLGEVARQKAQRSYGWDALVPQMEALYARP